MSRLTLRQEIEALKAELETVREDFLGEIGDLRSELSELQQEVPPRTSGFEPAHLLLPLQEIEEPFISLP